MGGWIRWTIPLRLLRLLEAVLKTGGPLQVWTHVGSTGFILIFAFLMSPYNAFLRFMLRRAAIWKSFLLLRTTHYVESYKVQKLLEWNMAPRYCGEDVKKVQVGETDSLNPSKKDEISFWYIKEFWKWNMMSRYSARYHQ